MKKAAKHIARLLLGSRYYDHLLYRRHHYRLLLLNGIVNRKAEGEDAYTAKWRQLSTLIDPYNYRLFCHFCGPTPDIIPEDILHCIVEKHLNPCQSWDLYEDKNNFARFVNPDLLPVTVASRQNNGPINHHSPLSTLHSPLFLKPSTDSSCGEGILRFDRVGDSYHTADGTVLSEKFLLTYGSDFILQQAVEQHPSLQRLSPTAVATFRLAVYRSVTDGTPHVTAAVLRVGAPGAVVDNVVAGGRYIGINITDGTLSDCFVDRDGDRTCCWNGINLSSEHLQAPSWEKVVDLALKVADQMGPHHLIATDITVDRDARPVLIEYNIGGFSSFLFHFTGQTVFGPWTDEVVKWVKAAV